MLSLPSIVQFELSLSLSLSLSHRDIVRNIHCVDEVFSSASSSFFACLNCARNIDSVIEPRRIYRPFLFSSFDDGLEEIVLLVVDGDTSRTALGREGIGGIILVAVAAEAVVSEHVGEATSGKGGDDGSGDLSLEAT